MGLHPRRRRKVVRLHPLSLPPRSLSTAVSISKKTVHLLPFSFLSHSHITATEIEGTFRVNGSAKRMRELQAAFETPPRVRIAHPHIQSHSPPALVRKIARLEVRTLHYSRRRQRLPSLPHTHACKFRPSYLPTCSPILPRSGTCHPT